MIYNSLNHAVATYVRNTGQGICLFLAVRDAMLARNAHIARKDKRKIGKDGILLSLRRSLRINPDNGRLSIYLLIC